MSFAKEFRSLRPPLVEQVASSEVPHLLEQGAVLIDVREKPEYDECHAVGAVWLSASDLDRDLEARFPKRDAELLLYCVSGRRSTLAAAAAQRKGYQRVASVSGGISALSGHLPLRSS